MESRGLGALALRRPPVPDQRLATVGMTGRPLRLRSGALQPLHGPRSLQRVGLIAEAEHLDAAIVRHHLLETRWANEVSCSNSSIDRSTRIFSLWQASSAICRRHSLCASRQHRRRRQRSSAGPGIDRRFSGSRRRPGRSEQQNQQDDDDARNIHDRTSAETNPTPRPGFGRKGRAPPIESRSLQIFRELCPQHRHDGS
jgi:hypothetical protein